MSTEPGIGNCPECDAPLSFTMGCVHWPAPVSPWPDEYIEVRRVLAKDDQMLIVVGPFSGPRKRALATREPDPAPLDVDEAGPGWWHGTDCIDRHDEDHNCLDEGGAIIGWRDPIISARLAYSKAGWRR